MDIPKIKMPQLGGLDGIKDRLGFGSGERDEGDRYNRYDEYNDYDELDAGYQDEFEGEADYGTSRNAYSANAYRDIEPIDASSSTRVRPIQATSSRYSSTPNLVTYDDVRAHTAATRSLDRARDEEAGAGAEPYSNTTYGLGAPRVGASSGKVDVNRSRGYNSLFGNSSSNDVGARHIEVIRPFSYEEAEKIAVSLRRGDVVVLDMAATDQSLYKRLLDFSFGAASMVNARVDCLASKIFSIQTGESLSSDEKNVLRNQGVL